MSRDSLLHPAATQSASIVDLWTSFLLGIRLYFNGVRREISDDWFRGNPASHYAGDALTRFKTDFRRLLPGQPSHWLLTSADLYLGRVFLSTSRLNDAEILLRAAIERQAPFVVLQARECGLRVSGAATSHAASVASGGVEVAPHVYALFLLLFAEVLRRAERASEALEAASRACTLLDSIYGPQHRLSVDAKETESTFSLDNALFVGDYTTTHTATPHGTASKCSCCH